MRYDAFNIKSTPLEMFFGKRENGRKNVHGGNFFTHFAIWVKISPLGGGAHKISVQKQVRTAAQGLVLIFAKV